MLLEQYQSLVRIIASAQPLELGEIVRRLRAGHEPASILASVGSDALLQPLPWELEGTPGMEAEFSGREQFGLVKGAGNGGPQGGRASVDALSSPVNHWTTVTQDHDWIEHLLSLYFSWQHQFFQNFPEQLFRADMASGRTNYCSELLVNALCAAGCLFSSSRRARRDQNDPGTAGLDFYEEALRLSNEEQASTLTTTAALSILCHIEGNFTHLSAQWQYSGRSSRMALDLNLHLRSGTLSKDQQSVELIEDDARAHVFWGCFITDQYVFHPLSFNPLLAFDFVATRVCLFNIVLLISNRHGSVHPLTM
ncbi:hypothetical protein SLS55_007566 [Diplodia seriata]|uniref:Xylanolytic transcriptional activator regulatory domain-containing protein n=1 Tax=Diplodia seriata TaxID=420778 RepID=A0ABR3CDW1_9PEZI